MAFDPGSLSVKRAAAAASRRVAAWANTALESNSWFLRQSVKSPHLSVREANCTDPLCGTPDGLEMLFSLTTTDFSLTEKVLKSALKCTREEVVGAVNRLCDGAGPRGIAARARAAVAAEDTQSELGVLLPSAEKIVARILTRIDDGTLVRGRLGIGNVGGEGELGVCVLSDRRRSRSAILRLLQLAIQITLEEFRQEEEEEEEEEKFGSLSARNTANKPKPPVLQVAAKKNDSSVGVGRHVAPKVRQIPGDPVGEAPSRLHLLESDGDEAAAAFRHNRTGGGANCPCCNPDDPEFLVDKILLM